MNTPVMTVNGQAITRFELTNAMQEYALHLHDKQVAELEEADQEQVRDTAVEKLLVWELIYQSSVKDGKNVAAEDLDREIDRIAEQFPNREVMIQTLGEAGVELDLLQRSLSREILVEGIFQQWFEDSPEPTDAEVDQEYSKYMNGRKTKAEGDDTAPEGEALSREEAEPMIRAACRQRSGVERIRNWVSELREGAEIEFMNDETEGVED